MATKIEIRAFFLTEYEEERAYLEERHRQGWKLTCVFPYVFCFEACEPEEYVYEIDFTPMGGKQREQYLAMCEDYGWEHVQDLMQFSYFRRKADETQQREQQGLFSDNASKLELAQRIFHRRMLPLSLLLLVSLPLMVLRVIFGSPMKAPDIALYVVYGIFFLFDVYALGRCIKGFVRLGKKYGSSDIR